MKGIIKGSIFSLLLMILFISILSVIYMNVEIPQVFLKGALWVIMGLCVFAGSMPVARWSDSKKLLRGMASSVITIAIIFIAVLIKCGQMPESNFYIMALICLACGLLGSCAAIKS